MFISAYRLLSGSQLVNEGPTLLTGFILNASTDAGSVEIYDGMDDVSGQLVFDINGWASDVNGMEFNHPIRLNNGLYVKFIANVHRVTILYTPVRSLVPLDDYQSALNALG